MRKGKMVAQGAHASMKAILDERYSDYDKPDVMLIPMSPAMEDWLNGIFTKVCVSVDSEKELLDIYEQAKYSGMCCSLIQDLGKTEFKGVPTYTAVAVGPADVELVNEITGHLKLL
jgi:PTH2 family peptidyl-tRNA hydrolase